MTMFFLNFLISFQLHYFSIHLHYYILHNISFFDLAGNSPKAGKTKDTCVSILKAIFTPPPLTESIKSNKSIPVKELSKRLKFSKKLTDRYRKYLIVSTLILDGDYPELSEYLHDAKMAIKSIDADGR